MKKIFIEYFKINDVLTFLPIVGKEVFLYGGES
jgi:hypothetical protein